MAKRPKPGFALQVVNTVAPGGIETATIHYDAMFKANGIATACFYRGPARDMLEAAGVEVIEAPSLAFSPLARMAPTAMLRGKLDERAPELAIVHSDRGLPAIKRLFPNAQKATPCHSDKAKHKGGADLVVTLNDRQTEIVQKQLGGGVKIERLGNPYSLQAQTDPTTKTGPRRIGFCARLTETKDPLTFIRAIAQIDDPHGAEFILAGDGPLKERVEAEVTALNLGDRIARPGWVSRPWDLFGPGDVVVLPSSWEGLPYLIQEALDHGVGVIAANNAGNATGLGDGRFGDLFAFGDDSALAALIKQTLKSPEALAKKAALGRDQLSKAYAPQAFWSRLAGAMSFEH